MSFNIDTVVMINDYDHLMGGGIGPFIKELSKSHVGHVCNDCNGSTICTNLEQKLQPEHYCHTSHTERHCVVVASFSLFVCKLARVTVLAICSSAQF